MSNIILITQCCSDPGAEQLMVIDRYIPRSNERNLGNYEDYKNMCSRSVMFYIISISKEEFDTCAKILPLDNYETPYPNSISPIMDKLHQQVLQLRTNYRNGIYTHSLLCWEIEEINPDNYYLMLLEEQ